jgi:hypothetical protein
MAGGQPAGIMESKPWTAEGLCSDLAIADAAGGGVHGAHHLQRPRREPRAAGRNAGESIA